jgi:hypothetical protein
VGTGLLYKVQFSQNARDWRRPNCLGRASGIWMNPGRHESLDNGFGVLNFGAHDDGSFIKGLLLRW